MPGQARVHEVARGAVIFDPRRVGEHPDQAWFDPDFWIAQRRVLRTPRGRGTALLVDAPFGRSLLRHYRRGGLVARLNADRYLWSGAERTRAFREFRLLAKASEQGLPVPAPLAARYRRTASWYRADILIAAIDDAATLAEIAQRAEQSVPWAQIGRSIAALHGAGIWHADLNAHNVLISGDTQVWIVDFDRARERAFDRSWCTANLERLARSLKKLGVPKMRPAFDQHEWPTLVRAHAQALESMPGADQRAAHQKATRRT